MGWFGESEEEKKAREKKDREKAERERNEKLVKGAAGILGLGIALFGALASLDQGKVKEEKKTTTGSF